MRRTRLGFEQLENRRLLSCTSVAFSSVTGILTIGCDSADDKLYLTRDSGRLLLNGTTIRDPITSAIAGMSNIVSISISTAGGDDEITLDEQNGLFAPGVVLEPTGFREIEITVNGNDGNDLLRIIGETTRDVIAVGASGINLNADDDVDVVLGTLEGLEILGHDGNDVINAAGSPVVGASFANPVTLLGGFGDDRLVGGTNNDYLDGGADNDFLNGLPGDDFLYGGTGLGHDTLRGGAGIDSLFGGAGDDLLQGGAGNDFMRGGLGDDRIEGGGGNDRGLGDGGEDSLFGGDGADSLSGGADDDFVSGGAGTDTIAGDGGYDIGFSTVGDSVDASIEESI